MSTIRRRYLDGSRCFWRWYLGTPKRSSRLLPLRCIDSTRVFSPKSCQCLSSLDTAMYWIVFRVDRICIRLRRINCRTDPGIVIRPPHPLPADENPGPRHKYIHNHNGATSPINHTLLQSNPLSHRPWLKHSPTKPPNTANPDP
jgi:hypothetical protein